MNSEVVPYHLCCKALENLYLEDSYVESISKEDSSICFDMEFVLTENHEFYSPPKENEQYCYRRGKLVFLSCSSDKLELSNRPASTDANGEKDIGNIDYFVETDEGYFLEGCWGSLKVNCEKVSVVYESDGAQS